MMDWSGSGWVGPLLMVAFWVLFVGGLVWLVANMRRGDDGGARRILDERFASGDLSAEEYDERRTALR
jgi:putative membrane protein